jgi:hypothetical protein
MKNKFRCDEDEAGTRDKKVFDAFGSIAPRTQTAAMVPKK